MSKKGNGGEKLICPVCCVKGDALLHLKDRDDCPRCEYGVLEPVTVFLNDGRRV